MTPWTFVHVADMQPGSPRSFRYNPAWDDNWRTAQKQIREINPERVIVGGDVTRDGSIHDFEMEKTKTDFDALGIPCHVIPGNMDTGNKHAPCQSARTDRYDVQLNVTSAQLAKFASYFGPIPWSFVHRNVRVTGFYAAVAGSGLPEEHAMWTFLDGLKDLPRAEHHVVVTHYPLFLDHIDDETWDLTVLEQYLPWYFSIDKPLRERMLEHLKAAGVTIAVSGHLHCYRVQTADGILFIKSPATCNAQMTDRWDDADTTLGFLHFDVTDDGIKHALIPLAEVSTRKGYGPGGHPKPELRDYSQAWEK